jgi:hypothetical protein
MRRQVTKGRKNSKLPTLRGTKQYKKYLRKTVVQRKPTGRFQSTKFNIYKPKGRRKPVIELYKPTQSLGWPSKWGDIKIIIHAEHTEPTQFLPRISGYRPQYWHITKSTYDIHILLGCKGSSEGTPEKYKTIVHRHYILQGKIAKGRGNNTLNKALSDTFNAKLQAWEKKEIEVMKDYFKRKSKKLDENSVRFVILKLNCYRLGATGVKEPSTISPLMKYNIRQDMSKKGYTEYKQGKDKFNPDQMHIED